MSDTFDASTIIFGLLAIFIVWKLRSVLGTRVTIERKRDNVTPLRPTGPDTAARDGTAPAAPPPGPAAAPQQAPLPAADIEPPTLAASRGLEDIRRADRAFDVAGFVGGAQVAYRMIIEAFSRGDREQLNALLGDEALRTFHGGARRARHGRARHADAGRRYREGRRRRRIAEGSDRERNLTLQGACR